MQRGIPCHVLAGQCDCILSHDSFSSGSVGSHEYRIAHFQVIDRFLLERIQLEWVLL